MCKVVIICDLNIEKLDNDEVVIIFPDDQPPNDELNENQDTNVRFANFLMREAIDFGSLLTNP